MSGKIMPLTLTTLDVKGKRLLIREDFNVPLKDGHVAHDARLRAAIPTLEWAKAHGASCLILSHLGRPKAGTVDPALSLEPVAKRLAELLGTPVTFFPDWDKQAPVLLPGEIGLCENVRFVVGEEDDDQQLAMHMAQLGDIFVMDAFAVAHRAQASTFSVARYAQIACAGPLLMQELEALGRVCDMPKPPVVAIVGGSKVSSKLGVLEALLEKVDTLIVGGGIANTFLVAAGFSVGKSLQEPSLVPTASRLLTQSKALGKRILLPTDVMVAQGLDAPDTEMLKPVEAILAEEAIYDVGPKTIQEIKTVLSKATTILWNGPLGVFEHVRFSKGTCDLAKAIVESSAFSVAGGGDTLAAIEVAQVGDKIGYVSTGGGAFLEYLEGKKLPGVAVLLERACKERGQ